MDDHADGPWEITGAGYGVPALDPWHHSQKDYEFIDPICVKVPWAL